MYQTARSYQSEQPAAEDRNTDTASRPTQAADLPPSEATSRQSATPLQTVGQPAKPASQTAAPEPASADKGVGEKANQAIARFAQAFKPRQPRGRVSAAHRAYIQQWRDAMLAAGLMLGAGLGAGIGLFMGNLFVGILIGSGLGMIAGLGIGYSRH